MYLAHHELERVLIVIYVDRIIIILSTEEEINGSLSSGLLESSGSCWR